MGYTTCVTMCVLIVIVHAIDGSQTENETETSARLSPEQRLDIASFVERVMECGDILGLALSVVERNYTPLVEVGFGFADLHLVKRVTPQTRFPIASNSKAFTSTLIAILIEKGTWSKNSIRLQWDIPIREYLGDEFQLYDSVLTSQTTLRDLMSHRTGVPSLSLLILAGNPPSTSVTEFFSYFRHFRPVSAFRSEVHYSNMMVALAGHVVEVVTGQSYEDLVRSLIFDPLNMTTSAFLQDDIQSLNLAVAYSADSTGRRKNVDMDLLYNQVKFAMSAGGVVSSAEDMTKWMRMQLSRGAPLLSPKALLETHAPHTIVPEAFKITKRKPWHSFTDESLSADLGWFTNIDRGFKRVHHSGSILTYKSRVWLYPDLGLGVYLQSNGPGNMRNSNILNGILYYVSDVLLGTELPGDDADAVCEQINRYTETPLEEIAMERRLQDFAGRYEHPGFLDIRVKVNGSYLQMNVGAFYEAELLYTGRDHEFVASMRGFYWFLPASDWYKFGNGSEGEITSVSTFVESSLMTFTRPGIPLPQDDLDPNPPACLSSAASEGNMNLVLIVIIIFISRF